MRGIVVPEKAEDFSADPVELFFDLSYVLAFSQLVGFLVHHPDWASVGKAALLFSLMWLPWSQFTWSANAVSGNGRVVRLFFLVATAASVPMAASVSTAFGDGGLTFAVPLAFIYLIAMATMLLGLERGSAVRGSIAQFGGMSLVAVTVLIVGATFDGQARIAIWVAATVIIFVAMGLAGRREWIIRTGHFAERHGLIFIIALGEVIVAIGAPVVGSLEAGAGLPGATVVVLVGSGVFAGLLWWSYFDRPGPALEHRAEQIADATARGRYARDVYTLAHLPLVAGVVLAAAGLEEIALHPSDPVEPAFRAMFGVGLGLVALGVGVGVWRAFGAIALERLVGTLVIAALLVAGDELAGATLVVLVDLVVAAVLVVEHLRVEHRYRHQEHGGTAPPEPLVEGA